MTEITASKVARYILAEAHRHGIAITNLKLQKLLYYCQGWHLAFEGEVFFQDRIEAWIHGPVVPPVFREYKEHRWNPIPPPQCAIDLLPSQTSDHIDQVMDAYGALTGPQLEALTHREAPWLDARGGIPMDQPSTAPIPIESMMRYFKAKSVD